MYISPKHFGSRIFIIAFAFAFSKNPPPYMLPLQSLFFGIKILFFSESFHNVFHLDGNSIGDLFDVFLVTRILAFYIFILEMF